MYIIKHVRPTMLSLGYWMIPYWCLDWDEWRADRIHCHPAAFHPELDLPLELAGNYYLYSLGLLEVLKKLFKPHSKHHLSVTNSMNGYEAFFRVVGEGHPNSDDNIALRLQFPPTQVTDGNKMSLESFYYKNEDYLQVRTWVNDLPAPSVLKDTWTDTLKFIARTEHGAILAEEIELEKKLWPDCAYRYKGFAICHAIHNMTTKLRERGRLITDDDDAPMDRLSRLPQILDEQPSNGKVGKYHRPPVDLQLLKTLRRIRSIAFDRRFHDL